MTFVPCTEKLLVRFGCTEELMIPMEPFTHNLDKSQTSPGPGVTGEITGNVLVDVPVLKGTVAPYSFTKNV